MLRRGNFGRADVHTDNAFPPAGITLPGTKAAPQTERKETPEKAAELTIKQT